MQKVLSERFRPIAIVTSDVEPFFAHAEINTVLIIAERLSDKHRRPSEGHVAFVTLRKPIEEIFGSQSNYWQSLQEFVDNIETSKKSWQDDKVRVHIEPITEVSVAGNHNGIEGNWLRLLRAPLSYFKIFAE